MPVLKPEERAAFERGDINNPAVRLLLAGFMTTALRHQHNINVNAAIIQGIIDQFLQATHRAGLLDIAESVHAEVFGKLDDE